MTRRQTSKRRSRRGAAAVEFALVAPLFVIILLGMATVGRVAKVQNDMIIAAREGARLASMDLEGLLLGGQTSNQKVIQDVRSVLTANGLPGDTATVLIADADDREITFDLDDPDNEFELFQVVIEMDYSDVAIIAMPGMLGFQLSTRVVFSNGRVPNTP